MTQLKSPALAQKLGPLVLRPRLEPEELKSWLEWAGTRLLALRLHRLGPQEYGNYWPDYPDEKSAYNYTTAGSRPPIPGPEDISRMEEILSFPNFIDDVRQRFVVHKRSLVSPVSGRYIWSYVKIAEELHIDARLAARLYANGIGQLCKRLPAARAYSIRQFFSPNLTTP